MSSQNLEMSSYLWDFPYQNIFSISFKLDIKFVLMLKSSGEDGEM